MECQFPIPDDGKEEIMITTGKRGHWFNQPHLKEGHTKGELILALQRDQSEG